MRFAQWQHLGTLDFEHCVHNECIQVCLAFLTTYIAWRDNYILPENMHTLMLIRAWNSTQLDVAAHHIIDQTDGIAFSSRITGLVAIQQPMLQYKAVAGTRCPQDMPEYTQMGRKECQHRNIKGCKLHHAK